MSLEQSFSFGGWANDHPNDPLPGDRVDAVFGEERNAINDLAARIDTILRADGMLNAALIDPASFPPSFQSALVGQLTAATSAQLAAIAQPLADVNALATSLAQQLDAARLAGQLLSEQYAKVLALTDSLTALQTQLQTELADAEALVAAANDSSANNLAGGNVATLSASAAEDWAEVAMEWAEHMPDTLPANILASSAVSGDHWSARWWANQAASAVGGFLYHFYLGAFPDPPLSSPTGVPIQVG